VSYLRTLYEGEVHYADREFGRFLDLLKWLGLYDQSLVILVGDHGEEFAEHGGFEHGRTLFGEVLRVPLVVKYPGGRWAGERIDAPVDLVDVAPTVLAEAGGAETPGFDGRALPGPGSPRRHDNPVYFEVAPAHDSTGKEAPVDLRGLVVGDLKCIENRAGVDRDGRPAPRIQAFNLAADPGERRPFPQEAGETVRCRGLLEGWSRARARQVEEQRSRRTASPDTLEELRALGYIH
ncbi:MAG TPA: sulfatase-like hydrolase/transferase, partial [Thermoanaerobaculia bacterium]|nr:sulfatase-like hydrolase/transferase [Thermoanaerobaculia bacterium]